MDKQLQTSYQNWCDQVDMPVVLKDELSAMQNHPDQITDAFSGFLSFGTAGMRGLIGAGTNRMNIYTVRQAAEGLARLMDQLDEATKQRGVAISFDSRYGSAEFAQQSAMVLGAHNIPTFLFDDIRPTPELSFAIRHLHAYAGIMITASHNPKQYNGFKIYGPDGGQMPPKESDLTTKYVRQASDIFAIQTKPIKKLRQAKLLTIIGEAVDQAYLKEAKFVNVNHELINRVGKNLKFVYSPLHGTGKILARRALRTAGFNNFVIVPEQAIADPEFPTVNHPNPEFKEAFDLAIKLGQKVDADVLIETDPDADRLGAAVRQPNGEYQLMTGNQIASVMLNYILHARKVAHDLPKNGIVVKSIVSTELATKIAANYGIPIKNVLTGFKFIAEQIKNYEQNHDHTFLFGFEESYGYLIKPFVRDKDAIQSTMLLAEIAAYYKDRNMTLYDGLQEMYQQYGYFKEHTISKYFEGIQGAQQMSHIMTELRDHPFRTFDQQPVVAREDFLTQLKTTSDGQKVKLDLPKSNVLKYWLKDGTWLTIRPSGTEPKIKFYVGTNDKSQTAATERLQSYVQAVNNLIQQLTK